jgi:hypothetical protein
MKSIRFWLVISFAFLISACGTIYKKHYDNGYTFIKHKKKQTAEIPNKTLNLQENSIDLISKKINEDKVQEHKKSASSFQTYHKQLNKTQKKTQALFSSNANKFSFNKIEALKTDTLYRKEPIKNNAVAESIKIKSQNALILGIISLIVFLVFLFFYLFILSLIPAIIALVMVKKINSTAKLNGEKVPSSANAARVLAWITIGLNILAFLLFLLVIVLLILIVGI